MIRWCRVALDSQWTSAEDPRDAPPARYIHHTVQQTASRSIILYFCDNRAGGLAYASTSVQQQVYSSQYWYYCCCTDIACRKEKKHTDRSKNKKIYTTYFVVHTRLSYLRGHGGHPWSNRTRGKTSQHVLFVTAVSWKNDDMLTRGKMSCLTPRAYTHTHHEHMQPRDFLIL